MKKDSNDKKGIEFIRNLMKGKSEEEIAAAEENFMNYLLLVKKIAKRLEDEEKQKTTPVEKYRGGSEIDCYLCKEQKILLYRPKK